MAEIKDKKKFHIFSAAYIGSTVKAGEYGGKKEIAFIGRSNVGKSSLINSSSGMRKLAYVSREPGKTRTINYYAVQSRRDTGSGEERQEWYLIDLPGYGFAKTSQANRDSWSGFIDEYIRNSENLVMVGALLGAFLLARIAEIKYFRVNIVACIFSLLILAFVKNDMVNLICIGAVGFFASSVFSIIYSMALQARPEKANQISGLMITAVAGGGVVTPVIGFAIGTVGVIGGVFVTLACVCYLTYCAFGVKTAKA